MAVTSPSVGGRLSCAGRQVCVVGEDGGGLKLFRHPATADRQPFREYFGHSSAVLQALPGTEPTQRLVRVPAILVQAAFATCGPRALSLWTGSVGAGAARRCQPGDPMRHGPHRGLCA